VVEPPEVKVAVPSPPHICWNFRQQALPEEVVPWKLDPLVQWMSQVPLAACTVESAAAVRAKVSAKIRIAFFISDLLSIMCRL
jgi:hypothetical protein